MGQKDSSRNTVSVFPPSLRGATLADLPFASYAHQETISQSSLPGDVVEGERPCWDNAWIDLGGEG
jgi:hypothetical protein